MCGILAVFKTIVLSGFSEKMLNNAHSLTFLLYPEKRTISRPFLTAAGDDVQYPSEKEDTDGGDVQYLR